MAEGRGKFAWAQTSQVLAMLYNANRDPKKPAAKPADFDPYAERPRPVNIKAMGRALKAKGFFRHG
jgi:hypothetical protein